MKTIRLALVAMIAAAALSACQSTPKPEPLYTPKITLGEMRTLEVLEYRRSCDTPVPMQCLVVKEKGASDAAAFGISFNAISGFEPKVGTRYTISVRPELDENNGQATGQWRLVEILSQYAY